MRAREKLQCETCKRDCSAEANNEPVTIGGWYGCEYYGWRNGILSRSRILCEECRAAERNRREVANDT